MEDLKINEFKKFTKKVQQATKKEITAYNIEHYCQTLVNAASLAQLHASMECSDRIDLIENEDYAIIDQGFLIFLKNVKYFTKTYLGLELITHGDPRGAVFKLVVPKGLGDSFGDSSHLCVPCVDAYQSFC